MQAIQHHAFTDRVRGVVELDRATYQDVAFDQGATAQAVLIVLLTGFGAGFFFPDGDGVAFGVSIAVAAVVGWLLLSTLAYFVGTRYLAKSITFATWDGLLRALGFAFVPLFASWLLFLPGIVAIAALMGIVWYAVTSVIAIRSVLDLSLGGAIITVIVAAFGIYVLRTVVGFILIMVIGFG